jgi:hypothetical protein
MNKSLTTLLTFVALGIALPASAGACTMTTSSPELVLPGGIYVDNDACQPECLFSAWIYQESNGIDGLQRGDEDVDDTCGGTAGDSDTILF